jgi:hypothetical protein
MRTIVYESNKRRADPVCGCSGVIQDLENQLMDTAVELEVLRRQLESYRRLRQGFPLKSPHGAACPLGSGGNIAATDGPGKWHPRQWRRDGSTSAMCG